MKLIMNTISFNEILKFIYSSEIEELIDHLNNKEVLLSKNLIITDVSSEVFDLKSRYNVAPKLFYNFEENLKLLENCEKVIKNTVWTNEHIYILYFDLNKKFKCSIQFDSPRSILEQIKALKEVDLSELNKYHWVIKGVIKEIN